MKTFREQFRKSHIFCQWFHQLIISRKTIFRQVRWSHQRPRITWKVRGGNNSWTRVWTWVSIWSRWGWTKEQRSAAPNGLHGHHSRCFGILSALVTWCLVRKKNGSLLRPVTKRDAVRRNSPWKNFRPPGKTCWYHRWKIQAIDVKFGPPQKTLRLTRCPKQWRTQKIFMGGFVQCHMVVICIWCALFVTSQFDVIFMFPNQRFGEVCWHNIHTFLHPLPLFLCHCSINYQRSKLGYRRKTNTTQRHSSS